MPRRPNEPEEAIGPALDGLTLPKPASPVVEEPIQEDIPESIDEIVEHPVALVCGHGLPVDALGELAETCGFIVEFALLEDEQAPDYAGASQIHRLENYDNFVENCAIDQNYFVCVFVEPSEECIHILHQCLASEAMYIGLFADGQTREEVFSRLKSLGAPDAELAAIRCPIGLNIGASTPEQLAVAITAELLATRNGTMKKLLAAR